MKLAIVTIALVCNHLLGWTYNRSNENHTPHQDSVIVPASHRYAHLTPLKWLFLGKNYRREWSEPVRMPVFHLNSTMGGFTIEKLGGGQQTRSLHITNRDGSEWVLRTVDKIVTGALPGSVQGTFVEAIVQDQISAAYPYAILTVHDLCAAVSIPAPVAQLYYVPDDPALGKYRPVMAHSVCMLMSENINGKDLHTESTDSVRYCIDSSCHFKLMQKRLLTARLFDMLVADWDRHKGQWDWVFADSGATKYIYPVPQDRDQAYFLSTGLLTRIVRLFAMKHLVGFRKHPDHLKKLNHKVHDFDRFFLNELDRQEWASGIRTFQAGLTDGVIEKAIHRLPPEIFAISGREIIDKLKSRRDEMLKGGLKYYDYLAKEVTIDAAAEPEQIFISKSPDRISVRIMRMSDGVSVYERDFVEGETKRIILRDVRADDQVFSTGKSDIALIIRKSAS